jgi:hypothetical protein
VKRSCWYKNERGEEEMEKQEDRDEGEANELLLAPRGALLEPRWHRRSGGRGKLDFSFVRYGLLSINDCIMMIGL